MSREPRATPSVTGCAIGEIVGDNPTVVLWPGAMEAGLGDPILYTRVAVGFVIAFPFAFSGTERP